MRNTRAYSPRRWSYGYVRPPAAPPPHGRAARRRARRPVTDRCFAACCCTARTRCLARVVHVTTRLSTLPPAGTPVPPAPQAEEPHSTPAKANRGTLHQRHGLFNTVHRQSPFVSAAEMELRTPADIPLSSRSPPSPPPAHPPAVVLESYLPPAPLVSWWR